MQKIGNVILTFSLSIFVLLAAKSSAIRTQGPCMYPAVATGAHNPANGVVAGLMPTDMLSQSASMPIPPPQMQSHYGAEALAEQILAAVGRCRTLGHRDPRITLTRPTDVVEGVRALLELAGLTPSVRPSSIGGQSVLTVRL